jgi:hypothetical protein
MHKYKVVRVGSDLKNAGTIITQGSEDSYALSGRNALFETFNIFIYSISKMLPLLS